MKKNEFVNQLQAKGYETRKAAEKALDDVLDTIKEVLTSHEEISFLGFGSFSTALQKGKSGKVPGTDKTYTTQDKMVPKFKFSIALKDRVAGKE